MFTKFALFEENKTSGLMFELVDDEVRIYRDAIIDKLSFVGDGVGEIRYVGHGYLDKKYDSITGKLYSPDNEVHITFENEAYGDIDVNDYIKLKEIFEPLLGTNGLDYYLINPGSGEIELHFEYEVGEY